MPECHCDSAFHADGRCSTGQGVNSLPNWLGMARWKLKAAISKGHAAGCDSVWKYGPCTCPGRAALHGGSIARRLDFEEEQAREEFRKAGGNAGNL